VKPDHKIKGNKRQGKAPTRRNLEAKIRTEGRGRPNQGEEGGKEKQKLRKQVDKKLMRTQKTQATRENREAAQVLWKEKTKTPTP
jgi:hypothetical protein